MSHYNGSGRVYFFPELLSLRGYYQATVADSLFGLVFLCWG